MGLIHPRCAGLDVSKGDAKVCVRIAGGGRAGTKSTVTTWSAMTNQVLALREYLSGQRVTLVVMEATGDSAIETVLLPARRLPVRADAGQCPTGQEHPWSQERRLGRDLAGPARRPRVGRRLVRATAAYPGAAGSDPDPDTDHPGPLGRDPTTRNALAGCRVQHFSSRWIWWDRSAVRSTRNRV